MNEFENFLLTNQKQKKITLFYDIETLQYNEAQGAITPTDYKNVTYSVAISYFKQDYTLGIEIFPNFKEFFETILTTYAKWKNNPRIELIAHNSNKYDNHFLRHDLLYYYPNTKIKNLYLKHAIENGNKFTVKKTQVTLQEKIDGVLLEKRIKSSNNLEMNFFINRIEFFTTDNYLKTDSSLKLLGEKLYNGGYITKDQTKTDFNYTKYNKREDMTEEQSRAYALTVFNQLNEEELTYIKNDVIILAYTFLYYPLIFHNFDYSKITFTSNILEYYNDNNLTSYQLLNKAYVNGKNMHVKYTNYQFQNLNFYDYLKPFYKGGLNFYNTDYIGVEINEPIFAIDLNSSYPYAMHNFKVPTYLKSYEDFEELTKVKITLDENKYTLYKMTRLDFDSQIIMKIKSRVIKQMLVKYYDHPEYIHINDYTIRMIKKITGVDIKEITVLSTVTFSCEDFGSKEHIEEMYEVKTQGSKNKKIIFNSPYDIIETDEPTPQLSDEEVANSKVVLNGLYGIPALRPYFNLFRYINEEYVNIPNGYQNAERNIVFSIFVTSVALYNLLEPFHYLTQDEIDTAFIYCDTDSLFLKRNIKHKLPSELFHPDHLGKWDIDEEHITNFYVLNHKKYAYYPTYNKKTKKEEIAVRSAGIPTNSFNTDMSFSNFIKTQFRQGVSVPTQKSIYNKQGTISIYPSNTELDQGKGYPLFSYNEYTDKLRKQMFEEVRQATNGNTDDVLFIESTLGTYSLQDLFPVTNEVRNKLHLMYLQLDEDYIKTQIISEKY